MEITKEKYTISTDHSKLDIDFIHKYLSVYSYWAKEIPVAIVVKAIENSLCFGLYEGNKQIGFARMVTDKATFAYMADVFIDEHYRGIGLSKWLVATMLAHPDMQGLRRLMLATRDAQGLYAQFGFTPITNPERLMQMVFPDIYKNHI
jgi:N-acetylglutamate synthase-like GNAT family acetyltransferase